MDFHINNYEGWFSCSNQRQKCVDSILNILNDSKFDSKAKTDMITFVKTYFEELEVDVNIDIKAQLSGIREILIMTMNARIMIHCIE